MVLKYFSFNHKTYPGTRYTYLLELRVVIQTITSETRNCFETIHRGEAALRKHNLLVQKSNVQAHAITAKAAYSKK